MKKIIAYFTLKVFTQSFEILRNKALYINHSEFELMKSDQIFKKKKFILVSELIKKTHSCNKNCFLHAQSFFFMNRYMATNSSIFVQIYMTYSTYTYTYIISIHQLQIFDWTIYLEINLFVIIQWWLTKGQPHILWLDNSFLSSPYLVFFDVSVRKQFKIRELVHLQPKTKHTATPDTKYDYI